MSFWLRDPLTLRVSSLTSSYPPLHLREEKEERETHIVKVHPGPKRDSVET